MNPNGSYMYVVGQSGYLSFWSLNDWIPAYSGLPGLVDGSGNKNYGVIDPYGRFLYVIDAGSTAYPNGTIYGFTISQTDGTFAAVTGSPFTANLNAGQYLIIDHTGQYLYAINYGNNTVSAYQINQSTGALTPLSTGATISTGAGPEVATLDPTGTYLYVANNTAGSVSSYSIGAGGVLTSLGPDLVISGAVSVTDVAVTPNGNYLYVLDYGNPTVVPFVFGALYGYTLSSGVPSYNTHHRNSDPNWNRTAGHCHRSDQFPHCGGQRHR